MFLRKSAIFSCLQIMINICMHLVPFMYYISTAKWSALSHERLTRVGNIQPFNPSITVWFFGIRSFLFQFKMSLSLFKEFEVYNVICSCMFQDRHSLVNTCKYSLWFNQIDVQFYSSVFYQFSFTGMDSVFLSILCRICTSCDWRGVLRFTAFWHKEVDVHFRYTTLWLRRFLLEVLIV